MPIPPQQNTDDEGSPASTGLTAANSIQLRARSVWQEGTDDIAGRTEDMTYLIVTLSIPMVPFLPCLNSGSVWQQARERGLSSEKDASVTHGRLGALVIAELALAAEGARCVQRGTLGSSLPEWTRSRRFRPQSIRRNPDLGDLRLDFLLVAALWTIMAAGPTPRSRHASKASASANRDTGTRPCSREPDGQSVPKAQRTPERPDRTAKAVTVPTCPSGP